MGTKDKFEIFDTNLQQLNSLIEKNSFVNCYRTCTDLTRYSAMSNYTDGLIISEILEEVFSQIHRVFTEHSIPDDEKHIIESELKNGIDKIKGSYKDEDKNSLYDGLKKIRNDATHFQLKCGNNFPHKQKIRRQIGDLVMIIPSKMWEDDKKIEEDMQHAILIKHLENTGVNDPSIHLNDTDKIIRALLEYVALWEEKHEELEEKYEELKDRYNRMTIQDMDRQSKEAIQDLEDIFGIDFDDIFGPYEVEGMLSDYSDDQSSMEWVRSVRSGT